MEGTKPRTASTIGMFDLLKGVGMLMIVFAHTENFIHWACLVRADFLCPVLDCLSTVKH